MFETLTLVEEGLRLTAQVQGFHLRCEDGSTTPMWLLFVVGSDEPHVVEFMEAFEDGQEAVGRLFELYPESQFEEVE